MKGMRGKTVMEINRKTLTTFITLDFFTDEAQK